MSTVDSILARVQSEIRARGKQIIAEYRAANPGMDDAGVLAMVAEKAAAGERMILAQAKQLERR